MMDIRCETLRLRIVKERKLRTSDLWQSLMGLIGAAGFYWGWESVEMPLLKTIMVILCIALTFWCLCSAYATHCRIRVLRRTMADLKESLK